MRAPQAVHNAGPAPRPRPRRTERAACALRARGLARRARQAYLPTFARRRVHLDTSAAAATTRMAKAPAARSALSAKARLLRSCQWLATPARAMLTPGASARLATCSPPIRKRAPPCAQLAVQITGTLLAQRQRARRARRATRRRRRRRRPARARRTTPCASANLATRSRRRRPERNPAQPARLASMRRRAQGPARTAQHTRTDRCPARTSVRARALRATGARPATRLCPAWIKWTVRRAPPARARRARLPLKPSARPCTTPCAPAPRATRASARRPP